MARLVKRDLIDTTQKVGMIKEIPPSGDLGIGLSDRLFLIGHADGLELNEPIQVTNIQDLINILGADTDSPLLRAFFDVYNEGARDVWVVAAAPMSEYYEDVSVRNTDQVDLGNQTFYEAYHARLATTYSILREFSSPEIIVPVEAPFYDSDVIDFLTQLADHCGDSFTNTGKVRIGLIGTRISSISNSNIDTMAADARLATVEASGNGKFISIIGGEASVSHSQINVGYSTQAAVLAAGRLSTARIDTGLSHARLKTAIAPNTQDWSNSQLSTLALAKINWIARTSMGARGVPYQTQIMTDNTLDKDNSTLWSIPQVRLLSRVINNVQSLGERYIGSIGFPQFKQDVANYLNGLMSEDLLRNYNLNIYRDENDANLAKVDINLFPFGTLRELFVSVSVGNKMMIG
jgi:hypothetical protein